MDDIIPTMDTYIKTEYAILFIPDFPAISELDSQTFKDTFTPLKEKLEDGWEILRCDTSGGAFIYILTKEIEHA